MIEDIKKEIKTENSVWNPYFDMIPARINYISTDRVCEILDKYKDKEEYTFEMEYINQMQKDINKLENYKNAWEELKKISQNDDCGEKTAHDFLWFLEQTMKELEKKHGIEVE